MAAPETESESDHGAAAAPAPSPVPDPPAPALAPPGRPRWRRHLPFTLGLLTGLGLSGGLTAAVWHEYAYSTLQARHASRLAAELSFRLAPGPSAAARYPEGGPYDERLGYTDLPTRLQRLRGQGYEVTEQARMSARMLEISDRGLFPIYREKAQAGLTLADCRAQPLFAARYPERIYQRFADIPPLMVSALLFIENRELLTPGAPTRNPAVEWDRFARAALDQVLRKVIDDHSAGGGSTLATQIEKYRHSPDGRTDSAREKLRQMASATLRAYREGEDTSARRREIVLDYLNTVPLSARAGFGEINGIGDGLWAWYGADFDHLNRRLADDGATEGDALRERAAAFKQVLALLVAQRRPSYYLLEGKADLADLVHAHVRLMAAAGLISPVLRDATLMAPLAQPPAAPAREPVSYVERKAVSTLRTRLASLLDVRRAYDLDRLDLTATSTLDGQVQRAATELLRSLGTPAGAQAAGLYGLRLLSAGQDPAPLVFSFTLYERTPGVNLLRVQTDSVDQPFDLNDGARLDLGSTSKLRTLVTYLELVAGLHQRWAGLDAAQLRALAIAPRDVLGRWARDWLLAARERDLTAMLEAAMGRRYSASPGEAFYTGGGLHTFNNFDAADNGKVMDLWEALRHSVNLPFIRLMRDVVQHLMLQQAASAGSVLDDPDDPRRAEYLARFADQEGREYLARFHDDYKDLDAAQVEARVVQRVRATPVRLGALYLSLYPQADAATLAAWISARLRPPAEADAGVAGVAPPAPPAAPAAAAVRAGKRRAAPAAASLWPVDPAQAQRRAAALIAQYAPAVMGLEDRAYVAGLHPLELWLAAWLREHPRAAWSAAVAAGKDARQQAYGWLFKTRHTGAQDLRIRILLEQEGFQAVQQRWKRVGYPFDSLTPSYASALGASGDRPAALAELMGILANDGVRQPVARFSSLQFAAATPYEARLALKPVAGERVLPAEVAQVARRALREVVRNGTAKRLEGALKDAAGQIVPIAGKTGTGDHRYDTYGPGGVLVSSRVVNRTATLAFMIGERWYGTMMAYVHEPAAANYSFTSALPSQLLKALAPALQPLVTETPCGASAPQAAASRPAGG